VVATTSTTIMTMEKRSRDGSSKSLAPALLVSDNNSDEGLAIALTTVWQQL